VQAALAAGRLPALAGAGGVHALPDGSAPAQPADPTVNRERMRSELAEFVDNQPEEIAQLVQGWLAERRG
jgi:flagellar M-ring protein FliF